MCFKEPDSGFRALCGSSPKREFMSFIVIEWRCRS